MNEWLKSVNSPILVNLVDLSFFKIFLTLNFVNIEIIKAAFFGGGTQGKWKKLKTRY